MATPELIYPDNIKEKLHLEFIASDYEAPTQEDFLSGTDNKSAITKPAEIEEKKILQILRLYIPGGFGDGVSASWANENILPVGGIKQAISDVTKSNFEGGLLDKVAHVGSAVGKESGAVVTTALLKKGMNLAGSAASLLLGDVSIEGTFSAGFGATLAPNEILTFKGTSHASLNLTYDFLPRNSGEVNNMMDIIDFFRNASRPTREIFDVNDAGRAMGGNQRPGRTPDERSMVGINIYKYPPVFTISVFDPDRTSAVTGKYFKYKFMVLTSFQVNFGNFSESMTYLRRGTNSDVSFAPTDAKMALSFQALYPNVKSIPSTKTGK